MTSYIVFTGHNDLLIHLYMLDVAALHGFKFDTVQMPLNLFDAHFRSFSKLVVPELVRQNIGILGMKRMANGILLKSNALPPIEGLHFGLNLPTSILITALTRSTFLDNH